MPVRLKYKSALLSLHRLLQGERGNAGSNLNGTHKLMLHCEKIGRHHWEQFRERDPDNDQVCLHDIVSTLKVCGYNKRVTALAWMKNIMLLDERCLIEGSPLYKQIKDQLHITEREINQVITKLPRHVF